MTPAIRRIVTAKRATPPAGPGIVTITGPGSAPYQAFHVADNDTTDPDACWYAGTNPADIVFAFTGTTKVREVLVTPRVGSVNNSPTKITLYYSDNGGSSYSAGELVDVGDGAFAGGAAQTFTFADTGAHGTYKLRCQTPYGNDVSPVEMEFHAAIGGPDILVLA